MNLLVLVRRRTDLKLFEPSCPNGYTSEVAKADMVRGNRIFYFRGVELQRRKWYQMVDRYKRTGEIWKPENGREFEILYAVSGILVA